MKKIKQKETGKVQKSMELAARFQQAGYLKEAEEIYRKILRKHPDNARVYFGLGAIERAKGRLDEAIVNYRKALEINPNHADAYSDMGSAFQAKSKLNQAEDCYRNALKLNPGHRLALYNLASVFHEKGQLEEAILYYEKALKSEPNAITYNNLGGIFLVKGEPEKATVCYQKAIQINPNFAYAYFNLGTALKNQGKPDEAIAAYEKAIGIDSDRSVHFRPHLAEANNNLGNLYKDQGNFDDAEKCYRRALKITPDFAVSFSNLLLMMNYNSRYDAQAVFDQHLQFARLIAGHFYPAVLKHENDQSPSRRLRIGYVSPDFRRHSVNYFVEPVLACHDHEHFNVTCYSDVSVSDDVTERLQEYADHWRNIEGMSDEEASDIVRKDHVDILVDLAGHTGYNRMLLFARKPAPLQVSWLGYPNTTGLSTIDFRLVDNYTDPPGMTDSFYTEKLLRLPDSFICYQPDKNSPAVGDLPALKCGYVTFGSSNIFPKVSPEVIGVWADILKMLPDSRLIMKSRNFSDGAARERAAEMFRARGIFRERFELRPHTTSFEEHLDLYNQIDISLDTFPYNGTTTTCEALWMGVPVITRAGNVHASRVGKSLLTNIGLPKLVAETPEEYVSIAVNLAGDLERLRILRKGLRDRMAHSPLMDARRFVANLENCYRQMWEQWCISG